MWSSTPLRRLFQRVVIVALIALLGLAAFTAARHAVSSRSKGNVTTTRSIPTVYLAKNRPPTLHEENWAYYIQAGGRTAVNQYMNAAEANADITYVDSYRAPIDCLSKPGNCYSIFYIESSFFYREQKNDQIDQHIFDGSCARNGTTPRGTILTNADESFFAHGAGTSVAWQNRLVGFYGSGDGTVQYVMNKRSLSYINYMKNIVAHCKLGIGSQYYPFASVDAYNYIMWDDTDRRIPNLLQSDDMNAGGPVGTSDLDNDLWNPNNDGKGCAAAPCTEPGEIQSEGKFVSDSKDATLEYANDDALVNAERQLSDAMVHSDGRPFKGFFNGQKDTNVGLLVSSKNLIGGIYEGAVVDDGVRRSDSIAYVMDICASVNNLTTKKFVLLGLGSPPSGSAEQLTQRRVFEAVVKMCYKDKQTVSWEFIEAPSERWSPEFPEQWLQPEGPLTSMRAPLPTNCSQGECTSRGAHDLCISGEYPNCVYAREFSDCWYGLSGRNIDGGPCAFVVNLSRSDFTPGAAEFHYTYTHEIELCRPVGGTYFDPECDGSTGGDVGDSKKGGTDGKGWGTGPGTLDFSHFAWNGATAVPPDNALWLIGSRNASSSSKRHP